MTAITRDKRDLLGAFLLCSITLALWGVLFYSLYWVIASYQLEMAWAIESAFLLTINIAAVALATILTNSFVRTFIIIKR